MDNSAFANFLGKGTLGHGRSKIFFETKTSDLKINSFPLVKANLAVEFHNNVTNTSFLNENEIFHMIMVHRIYGNNTNRPKLSKKRIIVLKIFTQVFEVSLTHSLENMNQY